MRRVIYAWNYIEWGGAQIHFLALIKQARKAFDVIVLLPKGTNEQFLGFLDAEGIGYKQFEGNVDLTARTRIFEKLRRHWIRAKSEYAMLKTIESTYTDKSIVHTDILPAQSLLSLVWLCMRSPVFITLHNALPPVPKWRWAIWKLKFGVISRFDTFHVYCTNKHAAAYFRQLFSKRVADDIKITYDSINPVEIDAARDAAFDQSEILERLGIPTNKFLVLAVGQFIDRKGRWTFLEAAKKVVSQNSDVIFVWVSPFLPSGHDAERVESFGLGDSFYLVRSDEIGTTRQDILRFFRVADIFVLPSYVEGVPIALLEAMAMGVPSISTNVYGIPEAIIHERTGLLIEAGDSQGLAASVSRLVSDKELRLRFAREGREHAVQNFDERVAARTAIEGYNEVLAAGK